jgi:hypothetical protein
VVGSVIMSVGEMQCVSIANEGIRLLGWLPVTLLLSRS